MTRFARAVGSKASNKREEEEATPWSMMVAGVSHCKMHRIVTHFCFRLKDKILGLRMKSTTNKRELRMKKMQAPG